MKYYSRYSFFGLFCVLYVFDYVFCSQNVQEQVSRYIQDLEYVDPHAMYYNYESETAMMANDVTNVKNIEKNVRVITNHHDHIYCKDSTYEVFARRLINMLVKKSNVKINEGIANGQLVIEATIEELEILKGFGNGKISIRQIDSIIGNIVRPIETSLFDDALDHVDRITIYVYQHRIIFGSIFLITFTITIALKVKWTRWRIIILIFDIIAIVSFILTWWELLQEAEIKLAAHQRMYHKVPKECQHDLNIFDGILLFFGVGKGDCLKHYEALMSDPVLKVTPLHAFNHMILKFVLYPVKFIGTTMATFIEDITNELPFPLNFIAKLFLVLFLPFLLGALFFVYIGGSMGIRLGPFLHLYMHGRQTEAPRNLLINSDRQAIEIIKSETREAISSAQDKKTSPTKKNALKAIKASTQPKKMEVQESSATTEEEESDELSDEYEKISKKNIEDEIKQCHSTDVKETVNSNITDEQETLKNEKKDTVTEDKKISHN